MDLTALPKHYDIAADLLSAMANPKRLMVLCALSRGEVAVAALAQQVGLSQSALSQHLAKLRAKKLVRTRRDAQSIYYSSSSTSVHKVLVILDEIYGETAVPQVDAA